MATDYSEWVGRIETRADILEPSRSNALLAALGQEDALKAGDPLPLLHHWLYAWDVRPPSGLGADGHPAKGGFLPSVPLPRRMWAGGRLEFLQPLLLGEEATRTSTILKIEEKTGKSGTLVFVTVRHDLAGPSGPAIVEEQDIVYRDAAAPGSIPAPVPGDTLPEAVWREEVTPDSVLLFRYSALTMNGHRIHYDRPYAMGEEAYPGLVVHGPLQATLLAALGVARLDKPVTGFDFRGQSPAFDGMALHVCGNPAEDGATLWTQQGGAKNMVATIRCGGAA